MVSIKYAWEPFSCHLTDSFFIQKISDFESQGKSLYNLLDLDFLFKLYYLLVIARG